MDSKTYSQLAMRTANDLGNMGNFLHGAMLVASEAGEIVDVFKKNFAYGRDLDLVLLTEEAGDLMWGANLLCNSLNAELDQVLSWAYKYQGELDADKPDTRNTVIMSLSMFMLAGKVAEGAVDVAVASVEADNFEAFESAATGTLHDLSRAIAVLLCILGDHGITLEQVFEANIAKLEKRYPDLRFNQEHATNRDKDAELAAVGAVIK